MSMLEELRLKAKKNQEDQKLAKEQDTPQEESSRPFSKILNFFTLRQEARLGILFALRNKNHVNEESISEVPKKAEVMSYVT